MEIRPSGIVDEVNVIDYLEIRLSGNKPKWKLTKVKIRPSGVRPTGN